MKKKRHFYGHLLCTVLLITLLFTLQIEIIIFSFEAVAENRKFEAKDFEHKMTLPTNNYKAIDFKFQEGQELEIIFILQVKEALPIDAWFVNEDNYLLLVNGAQFLYIIDGTEKQITYTKKVVSLTKHDNYKLVLSNYYNNQTVEVDILGEIRTFKDNTEQSSPNFSSFLLYSLILIIIIFTAILIIFFIRLHRFKQTKIKESDKNLHKKYKANKSRKRKQRDKNKSTTKKSSKQFKIELSGKTARKKSKSKITNFCGHCGKPVSTPYCKNCGKKV